MDSSLTRMHSSRMRTTRSSSCRGSPPGTTPGPVTPQDQAPHWDQASPWHQTPPQGPGIPPGPGIPLGPGPPGPGGPVLGGCLVPGVGQAPPGSRHPLSGQTHTCKHITLPQTSFAGGNNLIIYCSASGLFDSRYIYVTGRKIRVWTLCKILLCFTLVASLVTLFSIHHHMLGIPPFFLIGYI